MSAARGIRVRQVRSAIGCDERQRRVLRGLGLRRHQRTVELPDTPAVRGMIAKVSHLVQVQE